MPKSRFFNTAPAAVTAVFLAALWGPVAFAQDDLALARQALAEFDWRGAVARYTPIQAAATPGTAPWDEATLALAVAAQQVQPASKETIDRAAELYRQLVEHSKDDKFIARAMLNLGRIMELRDYAGDNPNLDAARDWYTKAATRFENDPIAAEATLRAGASLVMAFDMNDRFSKVRAGVTLIETFLAAHPNDPLAAVMWQYVGDTYFRPLDDHAKALESYEKVDALGWPDKGNQGPWYWKAAVLADHYVDRKDVAAKYYAKIITETPNSGKAYDAVLALRRLGRPVPPNKIFSGPNGAEPTTAPATQEARP